MRLTSIFQKKTARDPSHPLSQFAVIAFLAIILVLVLLPFIYLGTFSRYLADDYCFSRLVIQNGFWEAQSRSYITWSDRYSTMFVTSILDAAGMVGVRALAGILITGLLTGMVLLLRRLRSLLHLPFTAYDLIILAGLVTFFSRSCWIHLKII